MALKYHGIAYKISQEQSLKILTSWLSSNCQLEKPECQLNITKLYCLKKKKKSLVIDNMKMS